ncbi:unnamed protein product [Peronospora destructor]|uniref:Uncharacterized protein n=1 Tax=Peronospora destructor TaxID=86335 RepID=A0AAV0UJR7_9STRA|nr:unnamed protein product [Peronospora destructor]
MSSVISKIATSKSKLRRPVIYILKFQLIGIAAIFALTFAKIEAQTPGDSSVAGDDETGDAITTLGDTEVAGMEMEETGSLKTEGEGTVEDNWPLTTTSDSADASHSGLDQSLSASKASSIATDDVQTAVSTSDDIDTKSDDGPTDTSRSQEIFSK